MKKIFLIFIVFTSIDLILSFFIILNVKKAAISLTEEVRAAETFENNFYEISSLDTAISSLRHKVSQGNLILQHKRNPDTIELTEGILLISRKYNLTLANYKMSQKESEEELFMQGSGTLPALFKFLFDICSAKGTYRIVYFHLDNNTKGISDFIIRIGHA